jgi:hypothetical protein
MLIKYGISMPVAMNTRRAASSCGLAFQPGRAQAFQSIRLGARELGSETIIEHVRRAKLDNLHAWSSCCHLGARLCKLHSLLRDRRELSIVRS